MAHILATTKIHDFAAFLLEGRAHVIVLHETASALNWLTCLCADGSGWTVVQEGEPPLDALALDVQVESDWTFAVWELNGSTPLSFTATSTRGVIHGGPLRTMFEPSTTLAMAADCVRNVAIPRDEMWNTLSLPAKEWLFAPRFVDRTLWVIANTADGQAVLLRTNDSASAMIPGAFAPQAMRDDDGLLRVAFLRVQRTHPLPFWTLPRYHGPSAPVTGRLIVRTLDGGETDLGDAIAFSLSSTPRGPRILALRDAPVGVEAALHRLVADRWEVAETQAFDEEIHRLRTLDTKDGLLLFGAHDTLDGATLQCWTW